MSNFLTPIKLNQNEIQNAVLQNLASPPASPKPGQVYFDTTLLSAYQYNGTSWVPYDATKASNIPISALAVNPLARANQTGTQPSSTISDLSSVVKGYTLDSFAAPVASVPMNSHNITGLADPVNPQDAGTKNYIDVNIQAATAGIQSKPPVAVVSTSNISSLSGLQTIDGITLTAGQRVLLVAQSTSSQNGPYVVSSGAWVRASGDDSGNNELSLGAIWYVESGTSGQGTQYIIGSPTSGTITPGSTAVTINQFAGSSNLTFSNGLAKTGNVVSAQVVAGGGILAGSSGLQVDTTVVTRKYATYIGNGSATSITVTHNLGTTDVIVQLQDTSQNVLYADVAASSTTTVTITFTTAPATNSIRVIVLG